ncbi:flagellar motor switch protein FliN [Thermaerobacter sp. PB12/4term]|uniref:flagellar motor switch protein FliN n=1 Tax=Thermaerobacter sp. PB12/4term TaxID=2293838 RepID=UPI00267CB897
MGTGEWEMLSQEEIDALLRSLAEEGSGAGPAGGDDPARGAPGGAEGASGGAAGSDAPPPAASGSAGGASGSVEPQEASPIATGPSAGAGEATGRRPSALPAATPSATFQEEALPAGRPGAEGPAGAGRGSGPAQAAAAAEPAPAGITGAGSRPAAGFYPLHGGPEAGEGWPPEGEGGAGPALARGTLDLLLDVPLQLTVELGQTQRTVRELLEMAPGTVVELDRLAGEPVDLLVNGRLIARGEVVVIDENFGIRITDIVSPGERLRRLR